VGHQSSPPVHDRAREAYGCGGGGGDIKGGGAGFCVKTVTALPIVTQG